VLSKIHEKENEGNEVDNEIARTKVDRLNVASTLDILKEQMAAADKELKDKDSLIAKYQLEIRQRNDEIEKKMYRVDRLNKKYEKMVESAVRLLDVIMSSRFSHILNRAEKKIWAPLRTPFETLPRRLTLSMKSAKILNATG
jgi:chromosome segregation ATPase